MNLAPIVLFAYNRPIHLWETLTALQKNKLAADSDLYIFSDNGDDVEPIRKILRDFRKDNDFANVNIYYSSEHRGLRNMILYGVNEILSMHDKAIIVEDDIITSPSFLTYMNECLEYFEDNKNIGSITGYNIIKLPGYDKDIYLSQRPGSWGWATWADRWDGFLQRDISISRKDKAGFNIGGDDLYRMLKRQRKGYVDSWAIDWAFYHYKKDMYCVYPKESKVCNIGIGNGTNCTDVTTIYDVQLSNKHVKIEDIEPTEATTEAFRKFYSYTLYKRFKLLIYDLLVYPILRRMA